MRTCIPKKQPPESITDTQEHITHHSLVIMHQDAFPECPSSYPGMERHESPAADFHDIAMAAKDMGTPQRVGKWHKKAILM